MFYTLSKIHPDDRRGMAQVRALLEQEGISLDGNLDYTCGLFDENDNLAATGSSFGATLRCFAVDRAHQGEGLLNQIVSHLVERLTGQGAPTCSCTRKSAPPNSFRTWGSMRSPGWKTPSPF